MKIKQLKNKTIAKHYNNKTINTFYQDAARIEFFDYCYQIVTKTQILSTQYISKNLFYSNKLILFGF